MAFRIACAADAETAEPADIRRQLACVVILSLPIFDSRGNVPAKRKYIFDPRLPECGQTRFDICLCGGNTGQMGKRSHTVRRQIFSDLKGIRGGPSARTIGYAHERRMKGGDLFGHLPYTVKGIPAFRREYLKGKAWLFSGENVCNLHICQVPFCFGVILHCCL